MWPGPGVRRRPQEVLWAPPDVRRRPKEVLWPALGGPRWLEDLVKLTARVRLSELAVPLPVPKGDHKRVL